MHSYSKDFPHPYFIHILLAVGAVLIYYGLSQLNSELVPSLSPLFAFTIFFILEFFFDRYVWKLLCFIPQLNTADYSGTYTGKMTAFPDDTSRQTEHPVEMIIKQRWSKIFISFKSEKASSSSFSASIIPNVGGLDGCKLWYNYFSDGKNNGEGRLYAHFGTTKLIFSEKNSKVEGSYFTEQSRDSYGEFTLSKT